MINHTNFISSHFSKSFDFFNKNCVMNIFNKFFFEFLFWSKSRIKIFFEFFCRIRKKQLGFRFPMTIPKQIALLVLIIIKPCFAWLRVRFILKWIKLLIFLIKFIWRTMINIIIIIIIRMWILDYWCVIRLISVWLWSVINIFTCFLKCFIIIRYITCI